MDRRGKKTSGHFVFCRFGGFAFVFVFCFF
uniref:Uncharacterized protein n=1 Tax=Anguilla anguilla TaxID=7936 RepID=A0A0E9U6V3_ANGAN